MGLTIVLLGGLLVIGFQLTDSLFADCLVEVCHNVTVEMDDSGQIWPRYCYECPEGQDEVVFLREYFVGGWKYVLGKHKIFQGRYLLSIVPCNDVEIDTMGNVWNNWCLNGQLVKFEKMGGRIWVYKQDFTGGYPQLQYRRILQQNEFLQVFKEQFEKGVNEKEGFEGEETGEMNESEDLDGKDGTEERKSVMVLESDEIKVISQGIEDMKSVMILESDDVAAGSEEIEDVKSVVVLENYEVKVESEKDKEVVEDDCESDQRKEFKEDLEGIDVNRDSFDSAVTVSHLKNTEVVKPDYPDSPKIDLGMVIKGDSGKGIVGDIHNEKKYDIEGRMNEIRIRKEGKNCKNLEDDRAGRYFFEQFLDNGVKVVFELDKFNNFVIDQKTSLRIPSDKNYFVKGGDESIVACKKFNQQGVELEFEADIFIDEMFWEVRYEDGKKIRYLKSYLLQDKANGMYLIDGETGYRLRAFI